jgi:hypothetical protein
MWQIGFVSHFVHTPGRRRLGQWHFGFVADFELRISGLPGSPECGRLALFSASPAFSAQKRRKLGLFCILSTWLTRISYLAPLTPAASDSPAPAESPAV